MRAHTCQGAFYLLLRLPEAQHDGGLGEDVRVDLLGVPQNAQGLVDVGPGVADVPVGRGRSKSLMGLLCKSFQSLYVI